MTGREGGGADHLRKLNPKD